MRRGTSVSFWKNYERQQLNMAATCMPKTVGGQVRAASKHARPVSRPAVATFKNRNFVSGDIRVLGSICRTRLNQT